MSRGRCPHKHIQYCPLYIGMHINGGPNCWPRRGDPEQDGCEVEQGGNYGKLVAKFAAAHPREYQECTFAEHAREVSEQRSRNLVMNGIH